MLGGAAPQLVQAPFCRGLPCRFYSGPGGAGKGLVREVSNGKAKKDTRNPRRLANCAMLAGDRCGGSLYL
jgi:hypothetical protein